MKCRANVKVKRKNKEDEESQFLKDIQTCRLFDITLEELYQSRK